MARTTRVLCEGVYFGEGPRWHEGRLWFSDFYAHAVKSVSLKGDVRIEVEIDDQPSGLGWMPDGSMLIVSMTKRQVLRRARDGKISPRFIATTWSWTTKAALMSAILVSILTAKSAPAGLNQ
jgi:sugar lactone lactonase YvrE